MNNNKISVYEALETLYGNYGDSEVPSYIKGAGKTYIVIKVSDWTGSENLKIKIKDVIKYYANDARNIVSGMRSIAGHYGDWRPIDAMANEALSYFKVVNIVELRREAKRQNIEARF